MPAPTPSSHAVSRKEKIAAAEVVAREAMYDVAPMRGGVGSQSRLCAKVSEGLLHKHGHQGQSGKSASEKTKRLTDKSGGGGGKPHKSRSAALADKAFVAGGGGKRPRPVSMTRGAVTSRAYERTLKQATDEGEGLEDAKKFAKQAYAEAAQELDSTQAANLD